MHPDNCSSPLPGPAQTSYRAEVYAVLHVVRTAKQKLLIHTDCLNVAKTLNTYLQQGSADTNAQAEADLWTQFFKHIDTTAQNLIQIKWIPSHLDEKSKAATKLKHIQAGDVTEEDILGNVGADALANHGREQHDDITPLLQMSEDRLHITTLVQKMLLHIWTCYVETATLDVKAADAADSALMESIDNAAQQEADTCFDYDPFADVAADVAQQPPSTPAASAHTQHDHKTEEPSESAINRYPSYPWQLVQPQPDPHLSCEFNNGEDPADFGAVHITSAAGPHFANKHGDKHKGYTRNTKFRIYGGNHLHIGSGIPSGPCQA